MKIKASKNDLLKAMREEIERARQEKYEYPSEELIERWADWLGFPKDKVRDLMFMPQTGVKMKDIMRRAIDGKDIETDMGELIHGKWKKPNVKMESRIVEEVSDEDAEKLFSSPEGQAMLKSVVSLLKGGNKEKIQTVLKALSGKTVEPMKEEKVMKTGRISLADMGAIPLRQIAAGTGLSVNTIRTIIERTQQKIIFMILMERDLWKELFHREYPPPTRQEVENIFNDNESLRDKIGEFIAGIYTNEFAEYSDALTILNREIIAIEDSIESSPENMEGRTPEDIEEENMKLAHDLKKLKVKTKQWKQLAAEFVESIKNFNMEEYSNSLAQLFEIEDYRMSLETEGEKPSNIS